jgi:hypothetical protein
MRTTLRRLQQLEEHHSHLRAATVTSGAKEKLLADLSRVAERLRADPNWEAMPKPDPDEVLKHIKKALSRATDEKSAQRFSESRPMIREKRSDL